MSADILVLGSSTVDVIARPVDEFPPLGGVRHFGELTMTNGGCALNCCVALRKLGLACELITKLGDDWLGDFLLEQIRRAGIEHPAVTRQAGRSTPFTFVAVRSDGQRSFLHHPGTDVDFCRQDVPVERLRGARFCFFAGAMVLPRFDGPPAAGVLAEARRAGAVTLLDNVFVDRAERSRWEWAIGPCLPNLDFYVPSESEASALTGCREPSAMAAAILSAGCKGAVIKLGARGAFYALANGQQGRVPAFRVAAVADTTGAGDSWAAGFLAGLHQQMPLPEAIELANATAAMDIQHPGAASGVRCLAEVLAFARAAERLD